MSAYRSTWHLPVLVHGRNKTSKELKRIGIDKAKKQLGVSKNVFLDIKPVFRLWTPFGYLIIFEVPGDKWRRWMPERELHKKVA